MIYKAKSTPFEARQIKTDNDDGSHFDDLVNWVNETKETDDLMASHDGTNLFIRMKAFPMPYVGNVGDWIVKRQEGRFEFYVCNEAHFKSLYEECQR